MHDKQWCAKFLVKCESWLDKVIFFAYIVIKEGIFFFMDLKTLRLMSHEKGPQTLWKLKICLSDQVINNALWKDYL